MSPSSSAAAAAAKRSYILALSLLGVSLYRFAVLATSPLSLYVDEAQYWTWARRLDWGYYSKPPGIAWLIAATTSVCGDGPVCVKSGAVILYPLIALLIYAFAARLFDRRVAFWSALAFFTLPGAALSAMIISTDVPLFLCWTLALYAYLRAIESTGWRWWLLAGVAAGLGLMTKYTMVIFAFSVVLHLVITPSLRHWLRSPRLWTTMALAALILLPNLLWNAAHGWPTLRHTTQISGLEHRAGLHWGELGSFIGGQALIMGPPLLIAWVWQLTTGWRDWNSDARYRLLAVFALPFLAGISLQALLGRANANWAAMTYATGTIFVVARLLQRGRFRWLVAAILFNVAAMLLIYNFDTVMKLAGQPLTRHSDVMKRVRGWDVFGAQAQALQARYPGALFLGDSRDVIAELMYYVQPHPVEAVLWNPDGRIDNQYALTTSMAGDVGRNFIYITHGAPGDAMRERFAAVLPLTPIHIAIHTDYSIDFQVWLLQDFKGY
jgi:4-amino-4-deoxy-L-arabinose transferase-like glycosyltransferase